MALEEGCQEVGAISLYFYTGEIGKLILSIGFVAVDQLGKGINGGIEVVAFRFEGVVLFSNLLLE